jgi:hypothetical protein
MKPRSDGLIWKHVSEAGCDVAAVPKVSTDMVMRDWRLAKLWLRAELSAKSD